jgi:DHA2 family multidrug resistance protein-like MFS transporter
VVDQRHARVDRLQPVLVTGAVIVSAGLGPMMALATDMVVGAAPPERQGAAAAISSTAPQLGGALGIALLGSVITAVYRGRTDGAVPEGVPADAAGAFEDDLSATVTAAERLPGPVGDELLGAARAAFEAGFQVAAGVCAALTVATAVLVARAGVRGKRRVSP